MGPEGLPELGARTGISAHCAEEGAGVTWRPGSGIYEKKIDWLWKISIWRYSTLHLHNSVDQSGMFPTPFPKTESPFTLPSLCFSGESDGSLIHLCWCHRLMELVTLCSWGWSRVPNLPTHQMLGCQMCTPHSVYHFLHQYLHRFVHTQTT